MPAWWHSPYKRLLALGGARLWKEPEVRFGSEADICSATGYVYFTPESRHVWCNQRCPLWARLIVAACARILPSHSRYFDFDSDRIIDQTVTRRPGRSKRSERDGRDHEQIHSRNATRVIAQKRLPALGRRSSPARHILGNAGLPNIDTELEQFAMDPWSSPQRIGNAHLADQLADFKRNRRSSPSRL